MLQKKIVFIMAQMNRGGAERVISILSKDYAKHGWNTDICLLLISGVGYELDPTTGIHDFTGGGGSRLKRLPYWLKSIRSFVKKENPNVIVSFAARINVITQLACIGLHKKIVVSERNDPKYDGRGKVTELLTAILYPHASSVVFQTKRVMSYFSEKVQKNGRIIPNPIEVKAFAKNTDTTKIVTVGSLKEQKNHRLLLDAFKDVMKKHPDMQLYIYGKGGLKEELELQAKQLQIISNVHLPGEMANVHEYTKDAAMFVLSSDYEGLSNALLEAMMMGLPCISTDCAGSDEYIEDGKNGLLTPVGDKDALAAAMIKFIENDELRITCGENAKKVADRVSLESTLKQWHEVID